jgi:hypothetical protein
MTTTPSEKEPSATEVFSLSLETLRLLHGAASSRWANRREYEWKLSYAIWTALAGFIATIVVSKDSVFKPPTPRIDDPATWAVMVCLAFVVFIHWFYLNGMVKRTINDLFLVDDIEKAILQLDPWVHRRVPDKHLNSTFLRRPGNNVRYGLYAQVSITVLLSLLAGWFTFRDRLIPPVAIDSPAPTISWPSSSANQASRAH